MKKDYWSILGLKPGASDKEIRSAFRKLARKYHPDVNQNNRQAEEKFKEISEAHEVLTDPEKRQKWESGDFDFEAFMRQARRPSGRGGFEADPFGTFRSRGAGGLGDLFEDFFTGMGGAGGQGTARAGQGADREMAVSIGFEEAVKGTTLRLPLDTTGTVQVRIPPGAVDGSTVRVPGKGQPGRRGGPPGDLYVVLQVRPHPFFRREGRDVLLDLPLTMTEAALGTRIDVPTIDGRVTLTVPPGSSSGQKLRLKGRGVASRNGGSRGDQIVVLQIVTPRELDARSRKILEELHRLNPDNPRERLGW